MNEDARIPTSSAQPEGAPSETIALEGNHGDLIVVFGALSLFLCGPLGVLAWIMAESDLRKIRKGRMSSEKMRALKVGRVLGIIGTVLFGVAIVLGAVVINKGARFFGRGIADLTGPQSLPTSQIAFVGDWYGNKGTFIRIRQDGRGDFRSRHTSMSGGQVTIGDDFIAIGFLGFSKTWKITRKPELDRGFWTMELGDEVFLKKSRGLYVETAPCSKFGLKVLTRVSDFNLLDNQVTGITIHRHPGEGRGPVFFSWIPASAGMTRTFSLRCDREARSPAIASINA